MSYELLDHPDVLKAIRFELLRGGYPKDEIEDGVRAVVAEAFEYFQSEGLSTDAVDRVQAIVRPLSYNRGVDALRARYARTECIAGSTDQADTHVAPESSDEERHDLRGAIEVIKKNQVQGDAEIMEALARGDSLKEKAAELKIPEGKLRKQTMTMRSRHLTALRAAGYSGLIAGVLVFGYIVFRTYIGPDREALPQPAPTQSVAPPAPPPQVPVATGPTPEDLKKAADLRARAHTRAGKKDWRGCTEDYEDARKLDPAPLGADAQTESDRCNKAYLDSLDSKQR